MYMLKRYAIAAIPKATKTFYFLLFLFVAGVSVGASSGDNEVILRLADGYSAVQGSDLAADNFFRSISADALLLGAVFLLGFSAISAPFFLLVPFFKGLGIGAAAGALFLSSSSFFDGVKVFIGFCVTASVSSFVLILAAQSALGFSAGLFFHLRGRCESFDTVSELKKFCLKFLLFAVIIVINATLDTLISVLLSI